MKLNLDLREMIVDKATKKLRDDFCESMKKLEEYDLKKTVLDWIGTKNERARINRAPEGWFPTKDYFYIRTPDNGDRGKDFIIKGNGACVWDYNGAFANLGQVNFDDPIRVPYGKYRCGAYIPTPIEFKDLWFETLDKHEAYQNAREQIYMNLKSYKSMAELEEGWPEGIEFYTGLSVNASVTALAVKWDGINEKIGIKS